VVAVAAGHDAVVTLEAVADGAQWWPSGSCLVAASGARDRNGSIVCCCWCFAWLGVSSFVDMYGLMQAGRALLERVGIHMLCLASVQLCCLGHNHALGCANEDARECHICALCC
jgi:hypothetical protein